MRVLLCWPAAGIALGVSGALLTFSHGVIWLAKRCNDFASWCVAQARVGTVIGKAE